VQLSLLFLVARAGVFTDVGRLALASAASFMCGGLAELWFGTTLSLPKVYFGEMFPPLVATRRVRYGASTAGSMVYGGLWLAGLGHHDQVLLLALPLPFILALAYGYSGVMNAAGVLRFEGYIALVESAAVVVLAVVLSFSIDPVGAALVALVICRGIGTIVRAFVVRRLPQSRARDVGSTLGRQSWIAIASVISVVQGQIDMIVIGFAASLAVIAVYGPLVRTAYGALLVAEALSWSLYGFPGPRVGEMQEVEIARYARRGAWALGCVFALGFLVLSEPFLELLINRSLGGVFPAIILFSILIVVRFIGFAYGVTIIRAGRQRERVWILLGAAALLAVVALVGARAGSLTILASGRLAAEVVLAVGYFFVSRRALRAFVSAPGSGFAELGRGDSTVS
jgi:O-antigen/teichoic acid export membrane protein